jgi:hypothetical protein
MAVGADTAAAASRAQAKDRRIGTGITGFTGIVFIVVFPFRIGRIVGILRGPR